MEHPSTLTSVNNLASLLKAQGRLDEAEPLFAGNWRAARKLLDAPPEAAGITAGTMTL